MSRRSTAVVLAILVGVLGVAGAIEWWRWRNRPRFPEAPLLTPAQTKALATYLQPCTRTQDCEEPLSCVYDLWQNKHLCLASECRNDSDCPTGLACRVTPTNGPAVRLCIIEGDRREGEPCDMFSRKRATSCARGLLCEQFCGRPCSLGDASSCPEHSVCAEGWNGPSCVPSCTNLSCPTGTECVKTYGEMSVCTRAVGTNCQKTPCPKGQSCEVRLTHLPDAVGMSCETPCQDTSACSTGSICLYGFCRRECSPKDERGCPEGQSCTWYPFDKVGACEVTVR
jgi:hypothetical protein